MLAVRLLGVFGFRALGFRRQVLGFRAYFRAQGSGNQA